MPGKQLTTPQIKEAATLRAAGHSIVSISERIGCSVSTIQRAFKRLSVARGTLTAKAIERATDDLLAHVTSSDRIKEEAARLVVDDLAHARLIRERAAVTLESLTAKDTADAALSMRALAAYSTLLSNTGTMIRRGMRLDREGLFEDLEELPELRIVEMTAEDVAKIQREADRLGMNDDSMSDDEVTADDDGIVVIEA